MKKTFNLFIAFLFLIVLAIGKQDSSKFIPVVPQLNDTSKLSEEEAYKMLYENQLKSNDAILKTIFYALAGLGTAMIFVFASNWWFNEKKVNEITKGINSQINDLKNEALNELREKINLLSIEKTAEINHSQTKLQEEVTDAITTLTLRFTEFNDKIRAEIKEDNKALSENYQKQLDSFNENYRQQLASLNETISSGYQNLKETIGTKEEFLRSLINVETQSRLNELNLMKEEIFQKCFLDVGRKRC